MKLKKYIEKLTKPLKNQCTKSKTINLIKKNGGA